MVKKRILLIADAKGWVFDRHCQEIKKRITEYDFDIEFTWHSDPSKYQYQNYDLVYQLDPMAFPGLNPPKHKTILGLRNEFMYQHNVPRLFNFYKREIENRCRSWHVVNKNQFRDFSQISTIPIFLVQHGVDTDIFKKSERPKNHYIVVGTSGNPNSGGSKGFDIVERACQLSGCELRTAKQNLTSGHLSKEQMVDYYNSIDVYCNMSQSEGLNNCIMEAGACGVPVICTDTGAVREMITPGENGLIIPRSYESLASYLIQLSNDRGKIEKMGNLFMKTVRHNWSWNIKIEEFRHFFKEFFKSL